MAVLPVLLSLVVALSGPALPSEEAAVIEAVVQYLDLKIADKTLALSSKRWPLSGLVEKPAASVSLSREFVTFDGTHVTVSDELIKALRVNNKKSMAIKDLARSHAGERSSTAISRPSISRDGLRAVIMEMTPSGNGGSFVYLEKREDRWQVVAIQIWFS